MDKQLPPTFLEPVKKNMKLPKS